VILIAIAIEVLVFGTILGWLSAKSNGGRYLVVLAAFGLAVVVFMAVEMDRAALNAVWQPIR
jgi:hypothetical protein